MSPQIPLDDILQLIYNSKNSNNAMKQNIRNILGKDVIESLADLRALTVALDRQTYPTPMIIRFSEADIRFALINDIDCPVDRHDISVSVPSEHTGSYEPHIATCLRKICKPGSVAFDIGANVGYHAIMLAKLVGIAGKCYAFEPNSENCRLILLGVEHNKISNINLMPIALSDHIGWAYFSSHIGSNGGFVSQKFISLHGHGTVVPTFTLDSLSLPHVDVIKIDVEGAEYRALKGGETLILKNRPSIVSEFSIEMTQRVSAVSPEQFLNWISSMDYNIYILDRESSEAVAVGSISALLNGWGNLARIEDLLFLPREKTPLLKSNPF